MLLSDRAGLSLKWCFHLVDALRRNGLREAFISPGSRSTPLTLALIRHPEIRCHSVLDERAAAFMALGAGKERMRAASTYTPAPGPGPGPASTSVSAPSPSTAPASPPAPALFVCTSGTAAANALPAVVEARMSGTPLIVLSADRPPSLRATGSSQTIDQIKLFGEYPVFFFDTGEPSENGDDLLRLDRLGWQAVFYSVSRKGPVHLNLPFRKPLEPNADQIRQCVETIGKRQHEEIKTVPEAPRPLPKEIITLLSRCRQPLVIRGSSHHDARSLLAFCDEAGIPVLNEAGGQSDDDAHIHKVTGSQNTAGKQGKTGNPDPGTGAHVPSFRTNHHSLVLQGDRTLNELSPDLILRIGGDPVHRSTLQALADWRSPQVVFGDHADTKDATLSATHYLSGGAGDYDFSDPVVRNIIPDRSRQWSRYGKLWMDSVRDTIRRLDELLGNESRLTDAHVYAQLLPLIGARPDTLAAVSNSFPIRDYLQFGPQDVVQKLPLLANRGASGIDGVTATAIGAGLAGTRPVVLFTGDLAFLHDASALNNLMKRDLSLKIVILNNRGGTIFRMLPFENHDQNYIDFFETPQQVEPEDLARAHRIPFASSDTPDSLAPAWKSLEAHRIGILECRTDTEASMRLRTSLS